MRRFLFLSAAVLSLAVACSESSLVNPAVDRMPGVAGDRAIVSATWAHVDTGYTGPGSMYATYVPTQWNGDAIYFAHGIRAPQGPIELGDDQDNSAEARDALGALGYAIAYSSFSENGLAVKDAAQRTHQLRALLSAKTHANPQHNYLMGYSLGALASLSLVEQFPGQYDGLLAMCGEVAGSMRELQYVGDVRVLFDYFYPGVLPGSVITPAATLPTQDEVQAMVVAALMANPPSSVLGLYAIASTAQTPLAHVPGNVTDPSDPAFQTMVVSLVAALYYDLIGVEDVLDRTHGHSPYTNRNITYSLGTPVIPAYSSLLAAMIAGADASVPRYDMPPDARNYLDSYFTPTGRLAIPVVTVHNYWDYLVPFFHEEVFGTMVGSAGASSMLAQLPVFNFGHCNFDTPLIVSSFQGLVNWTKTGVKPF
jgi:hypothetical protein